VKSIIRISLLSWFVFGTLVFFVFSGLADWPSVIVRVSSFLIPQMFLFFINLLVLQPRILERGKRIQYFTILFLIVTALSLGLGFVDIYLNEHSDFLIQPMQHHSTLFVIPGRFMSSIPPIIISALIRNSILLSRKNKESLELKNKVLEAETNALRSQINPHFLFNTLNNIYSLSQYDPKKTGKAILQLSDILRYVTYEANQKNVPLKQELANIESFIQLQLLKDPDDSNLDIQILDDDRGLQISPLLILPIIENCFKHANHHDKVNGWIRIKIWAEDTTLRVETANTTVKKSKANSYGGGVGMENVQKRLKLLYPAAHEFTVKHQESVYSTNLSLELNGTSTPSAINT